MELRPRIPEIRRAGGELVIVGSGWPEAARAWREALELDVPVLCDEARASFRLAGFHRGPLRAFGPRGVLNFLRAFAHGNPPPRRQAGDPTQIGGVLVVAPDGALVYRYASEVAGDHAPPSEIVSAVSHAARGAAPSRA